MHPPEFVCKSLFRINRNLRLAWHGRPKQQVEIDKDETNCGDFALVQLFPAAVVGPLHDPNIFSELWEMSPRMVNGRVEMVGIDRGPIFNKHGGTSRDWDPITQVPVYIINLGGLGFDKYRILSGEFLKFVPAWQSSARKRMKSSIESQYRAHKHELKELASEATDFLWKEANKTGATSPTVAWKHAKEDVTAMYEKQEHRKLENAYALKDQL